MISYAIWTICITLDDNARIYRLVNNVYQEISSFKGEIGKNDRAIKGYATQISQCYYSTLHGGNEPARSSTCPVPDARYATRSPKSLATE